MSLRGRMLLAGGAILLAVVIAFVLVAQRQARFVTDQIDTTLASVADRAVTSGLRVPSIRPAQPNDTADLYIGFVVDQELVTVGRPGSDPDLRPDHAELLAAPLDDIVAIDTDSGDGEMRVLRVPVGGGDFVVGRSTDEANDSVARLRTSGLLAIAALAIVGLLVGSWVNRLSIRPIRTVTEVAAAITDGRREERVPDLSGDTEAAMLGSAMNLMLDTTSRSEARLRSFVADASHELRTPLTTVMGYADLYEQGVLTSEPEIDDAMRRIRGEAKRMSRIVEQLFLLAKLDDRAMVIHESAVDVGQLIEDLAADAEVMQPDRSIVTDVPADLEIIADGELLVQALSALLTNALIHTPPAASVTLSAVAEAGVVVIRVQDDGPGIPPEHLDHLFERFYRVDPGRSRSTGGSGLGLSIARSIIEAHAGTIEVESTIGVGTTFVVRFPA